MKGYAKYVEVESRWAKYIPESWTFSNIAEVFIERKENNNPIKTMDILSLTNTRGVIPYKEKGNIGNKAKEDLTGYRLAYPGDIVFNSMNAVIGSVGLSKYFGAVSPVYYMLYLRDTAKNNIRFFDYVFQDRVFQSGLNGLGNGILEIRMRIPMSKLKYVGVPVPPRTEQDQIVRYLDWQVSKINRLIAVKRKEIERIQEHLDKSIEIMFDEIASSSNDFIPLGRHITSIESGTSVNSIMGTADNDSIGVLSTSCVYGNNFDLSQNKRVAPSDYGRVSCPVKKNTLIISRMNAPSLVGACGFSEKDDTRVYLPDRLWQGRFDNALMPEYAWRYLSTKRIKSWFATIATGTSSSMKNITKPQLKSIQIPFLSLEKQAETVRRIKTLCDKCNAACHVFEESIMHLIDLRTRLISDVVTGQIDVRGIKVPDDEYTYTETLEEETEEETEEE